MWTQLTPPAAVTGTPLYAAAPAGPSGTRENAQEQTEPGWGGYRQETGLRSALHGFFLRHVVWPLERSRG